jgi:hypothetical protein
VSTDNPLKALAEELKKAGKRRIKKALTWESLAEEVQNAADGGKPVEEDFVKTGDAPTPGISPVIPPEFPRLLVSYREKVLEYVLVNNAAEWAPYHSWHTVFPPSQPASRAVTTSLEAELEKLKAAGIKERPKEDWQRRKESSKK